MNKILNFLKSISIFLALFIIYLIVISLLYYFEILSYNIVSIISYIVVLFLFFILGFKSSKHFNNKGYLNGFITSFIICTILSLVTLIIDNYSFSTLVYYLSLILSSITGGITGIQKK